MGLFCCFVCVCVFHFYWCQMQIYYNCPIFLLNQITVSEPFAYLSHLSYAHISIVLNVLSVKCVTWFCRLVTALDTTRGQTSNSGGK